MLNWLFLDMNSFFASCEQHDDPSLRGRPVGVCPVLAAGGAVIAASYDAKARGVGMGCRAAEARRLCPDIALRQARPARYVAIHKLVMKSIERHLPITKTWSIDEWALRLIGDERQPGAAVRIARRIKAQVAEDFRGALPCSVGLAPSRLLAKAACECRKPDGLTVITLADMPDALSSMKLNDLPGVGSGMDARLRRADVDTVAKLWALSRADCRRIWGSVQGEYFWSGLHGVDPVMPAERRRSMGHAHILPPQYRTPGGAHAILTRLLCKAAVRLREHGYFAHALRVHVSLESKRSWCDEIALPGVQDTPTLLQHLGRLWARRPAALRAADGLPGADTSADPPKKVGVDVGGLTASAATPGHLFPDADRPRRLSHALDTINRKVRTKSGRHAIYPGSMAPVADYVMDDKIAFGRIPEESLAM
ncbi:MAG: type VI secretion protein ImpB [Planctomycetota bacterium]